VRTGSVAYVRGIAGAQHLLADLQKEVELRISESFPQRHPAYSRFLRHERRGLYARHLAGFHSKKHLQWRITP
jgi:hypothetical protein